MKAGRPPIWTDPDQLQQLVDQYFENDKQPTLAGLAYALGINRQTLYNYEKRDQFFDIVKRAREKVESIYEDRLLYSSSPTGVIFALKNMGWKDRSDVTTNDKDIPTPILGGGSGLPGDDSNS